MTPTNPEAVERLIERLDRFASVTADETARGRIGSYIDLCRDARAALTVANARVAKLEAAVRPFAAKADEIERVADAQGWARESILRRCNYQDCVVARTLANGSAA